MASQPRLPKACRRDSRGGPRPAAYPARGPGGTRSHRHGDRHHARSQSRGPGRRGPRGRLRNRRHHAGMGARPGPRGPRLASATVNWRQCHGPCQRPFSAALPLAGRAPPGPRAPRLGLSGSKRSKLRVARPAQPRAKSEDSDGGTPCHRSVGTASKAGRRGLTRDLLGAARCCRDDNDAVLSLSCT